MVTRLHEVRNHAVLLISSFFARWAGNPPARGQVNIALGIAIGFGIGVGVKVDWIDLGLA